MKKTIALLCSLLLLSVGAAHAANGDIIGKIYSTDILAEINGKPVPSYNIGGRTAIVLEDLADAGYAYINSYDDRTRTLTVSMSSPEYMGDISVERGTVGSVAGDVYESDIKVIVNGSEIRGMNIGGKTAVAIEDLGQLDGTSENEQLGYSKYRCTYTWDADNRIISLDFISNKYQFYSVDKTPNVAFNINDNVITAEFDRMNDYSGYVTTVDISDEFKTQPNVLKPLYYDDGKEKIRVGLMYVEKDEEYGTFSSICYLTEQELLQEKTDSLVTPAPSADEALKLLDDGENYEIIDRLETEDFIFLAVKCLKYPDGEDNFEVAYVAVKKTGGYSRVYGGSTLHTKASMEKTGINTVVVALSPFAGPPGSHADTMKVTLDLNNYNIR